MSKEAARLELLKESALSVTLASDNVELLKKDDNFASDPMLALAYYHWCSNDPRSCVFNDENLMDEDSDARCRIESALEDPPSVEVISKTQEEVERALGAEVDVDCCALCNEIIALQLSGKSAVRVSIESLHENFVLSSEERRKLLQETPLDQIRKHVGAFISEAGPFYHLNPDLIRDERCITLCDQCAKDPCDSEFSIARGHDYGRLGDLPELKT